MAASSDVPLDDLGYPVACERPARRVVSLVPSLTEAVAVTRRDALAAATQWCTHPPDLDVPRVRGTKNPNVAAIIGLQPGIVLANQEENRKVDVEKLRAAGVAVWVGRVRSVDESLVALRRMFVEGLVWAVPAWLDEAARAWSAPVPSAGRRAVICVWRDPWMVVGSDTFTGDVAARLGLVNVFSDHPERYPHVSVDDILARDPEVVVLPDEPYDFTATDGPEMFPGRQVALVSGRDLTWYGPSLAEARSRLASRLGLARRG